jgi:hypothetical protein
MLTSFWMLAKDFMPRRSTYVEDKAHTVFFNAFFQLSEGQREAIINRVPADVIVRMLAIAPPNRTERDSDISGYNLPLLGVWYALRQGMNYAYDTACVFLISQVFAGLFGLGSVTCVDKLDDRLHLFSTSHARQHNLTVQYLYPYNFSQTSEPELSEKPWKLYVRLRDVYLIRDIDNDCYLWSCHRLMNSTAQELKPEPPLQLERTMDRPWTTNS